MDVGTILSAAQTLFAALNCKELKEICSSIIGYNSQLDALRCTVSVIKTVLDKAEEKRELPEVEQHYVEELKDAVYEADDLLDEFVTLIEKKKMTDNDNRVGVSTPFKNIRNALKLSRGVKKIKIKFDAILYNNQFKSQIDHEPIRKRRAETCSYVYAVDIIGREDDLEKIVNVLLDSNVQQNLSFITIVGIGGLGKTALAQLVYNDGRIKNEFRTMLWTCVADQDHKPLDVEEILRKILASATGHRNEGSTMESVQNQLQQLLAGNKYLLVLDDVWTENCDQWRDLVRYLMGGHRGSRIVVTTRSKETARIIDDGSIHELQGLSKENSWQLFQKAAFGSEKLSHSQNLVNIGLQIVERCARNPLAIRVAGSFLYGQDESKWQAFLDVGLANFRKSHDNITPILLLSYHHLESQIKCCFTYCALFPKDFEIGKEMLISLWMAQGYVVPFDKGQSIEDVGEEYFTILLRRCFFQDIKKNEDGEINSCKIHDLMHDIAQKVTEKEISATKFNFGNLDKKVRHLSFDRSAFANYSFSKTHIRSFLNVGDSFQYADKEQLQLVEDLVGSCKCLRALDLSGLDIKSLPSSIGNLLHLRYLDLSFNGELDELPMSITKLYNLQTLKLRECFSLKRLPKHLSRLVNLKILDIWGCYNLTSMPRGMGKLTCLHTLSKFIVGDEGSGSNWEQLYDGMEDLKALNNLKNGLEIHTKWPRNGSNNVVKQEGSGRRGGINVLSHKKHIKHITLNFIHEEVDGRVVNDEEARSRFMEELQPHSELKGLEMLGYHGVKLPDWAIDNNMAKHLPNLVKLHLEDCKDLEQVPCLGKLPHLKVLSLLSLQKLEYIEDVNPQASAPYFPSLEQLWLKTLPKLKGWMKSGVEVGDVRLSQLKSLVIDKCPDLTWIPLSPMLEDLTVYSFNKKLILIRSVITTGLKVSDVPSSSQSIDLGSSSNSFSSNVLKLRAVELDNVAWLKSLPIEAFQCLSEMRIKYDKEIESLADLGEILQSCSSSLKSLIIHDCKLLKTLHGGLEHLTTLEKLRISASHNLRLSEEVSENDTNTPWPSLHQSLRYLHLWDMPQLMYLPYSMQYLTTLHTLEISTCKQLESLPVWVSQLTSLKQLRISGCSANLERRCQSIPVGEDWPNIKHIPTIVVRKALDS